LEHSVDKGVSSLPTSSIDTFFACSLLVSVAIIATAFLAGTMQTQIKNMQDLNQQDYLRNIADHMVTSCGDPTNWGSINNVPKSFGLSTNNNDRLYELDADKMTRLNSLNDYAISYYAAFTATRLSNIAFGVSFSQMLDVNIAPIGNAAIGNATEYTFQISVSQDTGPVRADLHSYIIANNFTGTASNSTSDSGFGQIAVDIPNSSSGPSTLLVFARAAYDDRLTSFAVFSFQHLSESPQTNQSFVSLSPLNYTLNLRTNYPNITVEKAYAFTYSRQSDLNFRSNSSCPIPDFLDKSPIVLLVQSKYDSTSYNDWTAYPEVPLNFGADFSHSEINAFVYPVTINDVLYKLTLLFGDVIN
jgi:hypothetical protein